MKLLDKNIHHNHKPAKSGVTRSPAGKTRHTTAAAKPKAHINNTAPKKPLAPKGAKPNHPKMAGKGLIPKTAPHQKPITPKPKSPQAAIKGKMPTPIVIKPVHKPKPTQVSVRGKPHTILQKPMVKTPIKGVAGSGFRKFKDGIMLNDGKGNLDDRNDWLETIPTKNGEHIAAYCLKVPYKEWIYNFQTDCTMDPDFMNWLFQVFVPREEAKERLYPYQEVQPGLTRKEMLYAIKYKRVKYLNENQRKEKVIQITQDGLLVNHKGYLYHTGTESTMNSGPGWAIFVMDKNDTLYAGSHIPGEFHHSSFLGGNFVSSAGEIAVSYGKIVAITCKSGHYRPSIKNMLYFLTNLYCRHVDLKNIPIQMEWNGEIPRFFDSYDALMSQGKYSRLLPAPPKRPVY